MTEYGQLKEKSGDVINIPDWYEKQRENVKKELENGDYCLEFQVDIEALPNEKGFVPMGKGVLVHDKSGFSLDILNSYQHLFFPTKQLYTIQTEYNYKGRGKCIVLSTKDCCYYLYSKQPEFNPTKLQFAAEIIHADEKLIRKE